MRGGRTVFLLSTPRSKRDLEYDYLSIAYQMEDLLQRKAAAHTIDAELEATHRHMVALAGRISEGSRDSECDYLASVYKMQDLLQQKSRAYHLEGEFVTMQKQLEDVAGQMGWDTSAESPADALLTGVGYHEHVAQLRNEIQELRSSLA